MLVYFVVFALSSILMFFAEHFHGYSKFISYLLYVVIILITSTLAAFRDMTCGIDIYVYENQAFLSAVATDSFSKLCDHSILEPFFLLLNYMAAGISHNIGIAFFLIQAVMVTFWIAACVRLKEIVPSWLSFPLLLIGYFPLSFNLMRQCIAIAFITFAYADLYKTDNLKKFFIMSICAFFLHKTALPACLLLLAIHWAWNLKSSKARKFFFLAIGIGCLGLSVFFIQILNLIALLGGRYAQYVAYAGGSGHFQPNIISILIYGQALLLIFAAWLYKANLLDRRTAYIYTLILLASLSFETLGRFAGFATRFDMYFCALQCFFIPILMQNNKISSRTRAIGKVATLFIFLCIFYKLNDSMGHTVPYKSAFLGFI